MCLDGDEAILLGCLTASSSSILCSCVYLAKRYNIFWELCSCVYLAKRYNIVWELRIKSTLIEGFLYYNRSWLFELKLVFQEIYHFRNRGKQIHKPCQTISIVLLLERKLVLPEIYHFKNTNKQIHKPYQMISIASTIFSSCKLFLQIQYYLFLQN